MKDIKALQRNNGILLLLCSSSNALNLCLDYEGAGWARYLLAASALLTGVALIVNAVFLIKAYRENETASDNERK